MERLIEELISVVKNINRKDFFDYFAIVLTLANVWIVWLTTSRQIKNQNKQSMRPYLDIEEVKLDSNGNEDKKGMILFDEYTSNAKLGTLSSISYTNQAVGTSLKLENKGNGLARNIKIFNSMTEEEIVFTIKRDSLVYIDNEKLYTAISDNQEIIVYSKYVRKEDVEISDKVLLLLFYEDINGNLYSMDIKVEIYYNENSKTFNWKTVSSKTKDIKTKNKIKSIIENSDLYNWIKS